MSRVIAVCSLALIALALLVPVARAEPYLAVRTGFKCMQCHENPTGGGMRNTFGNVYAQTELAATRIGPEEEPWTGMIHRYLSIGGNLRANADWTRVPNQQNTSEF